MLRLACLLLFFSVASAFLQQRMKYNFPLRMSSTPQDEESIPSTVSDLPLAIERLAVAFKDSTTGPQAVEDLDQSAKMFPNEKFISSPQSKWFQQNSPDENYSEETKAKLLQSLQAAYPGITGQ